MILACDILGQSMILSRDISAIFPKYREFQRSNYSTSFQALPNEIRVAIQRGFNTSLRWLLRLQICIC